MPARSRWATMALTLTGNGNLAVSGPIGEVVGAGSLTKAGSGALTLTGVNTFTGGFAITGGSVIAKNDASLGDPSSPITLSNGASLSFTDSAISTVRTFNLGTSTLASAPGGSLTFQSGASVTGGIIGAGSYTLAGNSSFNDLQFAGGTSITQTNSASVAFNNITLAGNATLTQNAGATLNVTGNFTADPATALAINGQMNTAGGLLSGSVLVNSGGKIANAGSPLFLFGGAGTTINSGGSLAAAGGSSIELGGLLVNNGTQTGLLDVNFGGLAKGAGSFGDVHVNNGGKFSPGNSPGAATVSSLTLASGGSYQFEIRDAAGTPGSGFDFVHDTGPLNITATSSSVFAIDVLSLNASNQPGAAANFDPTHSYNWVLATADGGISGFDPAGFLIQNGFQNNLQGGSFGLVHDGNNLELQFLPAPEPATVSLIAMAGAIGLLRRGRRTANA